MPGELSGRDFLSGILEGVRARLPDELRALDSRHQGNLIKFFADDPAIHYEFVLHSARARVELALHFETRDAALNACLLDYVADELPFLKDVLGPSLEAEPWDRGWTRLYLTRPLERLSAPHLETLSETFTQFIAVLEPIRQEAVEATRR